MEEDYQEDKLEEEVGGHMKIKVMIYDDEYYPFYYIDKADENDSRFIYEINEELFKKYTDMRNKLNEIEEEIDAIVHK